MLSYNEAETGNESTVNTGEIIKSLWLDLGSCMFRVISESSDLRSSYYSGRVSGLRFVLPLLRGSDSKCRLLQSRITFEKTSRIEELNLHAKLLKSMLEIDFEALREGGKYGANKEWLEGHIRSIGQSLAMVQHFLLKK